MSVVLFVLGGLMFVAGLMGMGGADSAIQQCVAATLLGCGLLTVGVGYVATVIQSGTKRIVEAFEHGNQAR
ncbi:MAG: hypothetical protein QUS11_09020 [Candidatus Fermentibacter sp.]|nr:hypothetical protein [Candidatus Fermentibacter sp.]